mgnify:CR=1 FL=1
MPELILTADHPSPSPRLDTSPSCSFSLSLPSLSGFLLPQLLFHTVPARSLHNRIIRFLSAFFSFPASLIDLPKKGFRGPVFERKGGATESFF